MPTSELLPDFPRDYAKLNEAQKKAFRLAVKKFVVDLRHGSFRGSLRVKPMQDNPNIFEMTWGRAGWAIHLRLRARTTAGREAYPLAPDWQP
jgi:hypothetical protein